MKKSLLALALTISTLSHAYEPDENLDPVFKDIFNEMLKIDKDRSKDNLTGREIEVDLEVKLATEKFLVFSDAYIKTDENTKYQIGKWSFDKKVKKSLKNIESGKEYKVKIEVISLHFRTMPFFYGEIMSIEEIKKESI